MQASSNWKNYLKTFLVPILSLLAMAWALQSFAGFNTDGEFYVLDKVKAPAPGTLDKPGSVAELDYLRWTYLVSPIAPQDEIDTAGSAAPLLEKIEAKAKAAAAVPPAELIAPANKEKYDAVVSALRFYGLDPAKQATYEQILAALLTFEMRKKSPGPYLKNIWAWYRNELAYEQGHAARVEEMSAKKSEWIAAWLAEAKFNADNAAEIKKRSEERAAFAAKPESSLAALFVKVELNTQAVLLGVEWDRRNAAAIKAFNEKKAATLPALVKQFIENPGAAQDSDRAAAEKAYEAALADLKASAFLRPEIYRSIQNSKAQNMAEDLKRDSTLQACPAKNCKEDDFAIHVDVENALLQALEIEATTDLPKYATVGFDGYTIIDAPIDAAAAAYQFRNGVPVRAAEFGWKQGATYPVDKLFNFRRETSLDMSEFWGPGAHFNTSIKERPSSSFVNGLSDAYVVLTRGNKTDGYDIFFQLLGKACFTDKAGVADEGQDPGNCLSETTSNFTILMLRPLGENRTAYKISGRFMGQSYKGLPYGRGFVGFNIDNFFRGQFEFNEQAKQIAAGMAAIRAGQDVKHLSSETTGHYFDKRQMSQTKTKYPISLQQNFYLVDGKLVQVLEDRGSKDFDNKGAMQTYPVKALWE